MNPFYARFGTALVLNLLLFAIGLVPSFWVFAAGLIGSWLAIVAIWYASAPMLKKVTGWVSAILLVAFIALPVTLKVLEYYAPSSPTTAAAMKLRRKATDLRVGTWFRHSGLDAEAMKQDACNRVEEFRTTTIADEYEAAVAAVKAAPWSDEAAKTLDKVNQKKAWIAAERDRCKKEEKLAAGYVPTLSGGGTSGGGTHTPPVAAVRPVYQESSVLDDISPEMVGIMVLAGIGLILITRKASGFGILVGLVLGVSLGLMLILQYYPRYGVTEEVVASALTAAAILAVAGWFGGARSMTVALIFAFAVSLIPAGSHAIQWSKKHDPDSVWVLHADGRRY